MKIRPHEAFCTYDESMLYVSEVASRPELLRFIQQNKSELHAEAESDIRFVYRGQDERNGWQTYDVLVVANPVLHADSIFPGDRPSAGLCICAGLCIFCEEPLLPSTIDPDGPQSAMHMECMTRSVVGSVAHQLCRCSCFIPGSEEGDPPGMTRRQAALAAVETMRLRNAANILNIDGACPLCGCKDFHPGPRGGAARNIKCSDCGAKFWYSPPFQPHPIYGQPDEVYDMSVRERLPKEAS
jgi:hypothetical protein